MRYLECIHLELVMDLEPEIISNDYKNTKIRSEPT